VRYNDRGRVNEYAGKAWTLLGAPATTIKQLPSERAQPLHDAVYASPYGNELLLAMAEEALQQEQLGARGVTDVLSISFSSNDSVGHTYGPDSEQVRDIAVKTDRTLGRLLARVDKLVGLQHTLVAFTTDHGVAPLPEVVQRQGLGGGRMTNAQLFGPIEAALTTRFGEGTWILATAGSSPYLNHPLMEAQRRDPAEVRRVAAEAAAQVPHVARVYTRDQLLRGDVPDDRIGRRVLRGFHPQRSGDLEIILEPYWIRQATGTTHGTAYNYDTHIPLILMGRRFAPGEYADHAALNDLAPTIANALGVQVPSGSAGRVLTEALRRPVDVSTRRR
jgi:arylsulfatase A-like enzyme